MDIDETRTNDQPSCIDLFNFGFRISDFGFFTDPAIDNPNVIHFIPPVSRIDDPSVANQRFHGRAIPAAEIKHRHAHGEAVGHLIEDDALRAVRQFAVDLHAAIDWPGMHDQTVRLEQPGPLFRQAEEADIFAQAGKIFLPLPFMLDTEQVHHIRGRKHVFKFVRDGDPELLKYRAARACWGQRV